MKNSLKKIKAFTMAEVLIAIAVLGFIAVTVLPALMNSMPSNNKIMFKKSYYILNEAINEIINNDVNYPVEQTITTGGVEYPRGFNYTTATSNGTATKFCYFLSQALDLDGTASCPSRTTSYVGGTFTTTDGVAWTVYTGVSDSTNDSITPTTAATTASYQFPINPDLFVTKVILDVNGTKGPNCTLDTQGSTYGTNYLATCKDPDRFIIGVRYDGRLQVGCSTNTTACTAATDQNAIDILGVPVNYQKD